MNHLAIAATVLTTMFFVSGVDKVSNFNKVVDGLRVRVGPSLPTIVAQLMILGAIAIELLAPPMTVYAALRRSLRIDRWGAYASLALIVFTVLATLVYHFPPVDIFQFPPVVDSKKYYPFMSNLATSGGLYLLYRVFATNSAIGG